MSGNDLAQDIRFRYISKADLLIISNNCLIYIYKFLFNCFTHQVEIEHERRSIKLLPQHQPLFNLFTSRFIFIMSFLCNFFNCIHNN